MDCYKLANPLPSSMPEYSLIVKLCVEIIIKHIFNACIAWIIIHLTILILLIHNPPLFLNALFLGIFALLIVWPTAYRGFKNFHIDVRDILILTGLQKYSFLLKGGSRAKKD